MAITNFTVDYTGRTRDINIFQVANYTNGQTQTTSVVFGPVSKYVAGVEKLVQRWAILFMTAVGSQINYPTFGTEFIEDIFPSNSSNLSKLDALHLFNFANLDVISVFTTYQANNPGAPDDEQFASAQLVGFSSTADSLNMQVAITSIAGSSLTFVLPIPLNN